MSAALNPNRRRIARRAARCAALAVFLSSSLLIAVASATSARADDRRIELVMFESAYCEWCELWDQEIGVVYHKTAEGMTAPLRRVQLSDDRPADLAALKRVQYTPTFVLMSQGEEIGRILGYPGEDFFWPMLQKLLERERAENG